MDKTYKCDYEKTPDYCYTDGDALINKMNIHDAKKLHLAEEKLIAIRLYQLIENPIKENFDL
ncbi:MAG: hypothetical protein HFG16_00925 [Erysipelotrichaceae bacterium]|jgi:cell filamentation protein|nr:hypothetical protein [Erysipelotrichaceae bacterium]